MVSSRLHHREMDTVGQINSGESGIEKQGR